MQAAESRVDWSPATALHFAEDYTQHLGFSNDFIINSIML